MGSVRLEGFPIVIQGRPDMFYGSYLNRIEETRHRDLPAKSFDQNHHPTLFRNTQDRYGQIRICGKLKAVVCAPVLVSIR